MVARKWLGGGSNSASSPQDWSPTGRPQPGDTLSISGSGGQPYTMFVQRVDLAGDVLSIGGANPTINMSRQAIVTVGEIAFSNATFNLSQNSILNIQEVVQAALTVKVVGDDNARFTLGVGSSGTVDIARNSTWHGTFTIGSFSVPSLTVNGAAGTAFDNSGTSEVEALSKTTINANVVGNGEFDVHSPIEFAKGVGSGQSVLISSLHDFDQGIVKIDQPRKFLGSITMEFLPPASPNTQQTAPEVDLSGLAGASSYHYQFGVLEIFAGNTLIDSLRINKITNGFTVEKVGNSVHIVANSDPINHPVGLPLHV